MKKPIPVILLFVATMILACKHEVLTKPSITFPTIDTTASVSGSVNSQPKELCFEGDILPIFKSNCAKSGCHDVTTHQKGYILDSYENIIKGVTAGNADNSKVYKMITEKDENKRMPQAPNPRLDTMQIGFIKRWINEGAKNTTNCTTACDTTLYSYSKFIRPLVDANCVGCHNGPSAPLGLDYTTYEGVKNVALNGRMIGALTHVAGYSPMPKNSPQLSDCKITQIKKWIQAGAPNN